MSGDPQQRSPTWRWAVAIGAAVVVVLAAIALRPAAAPQVSTATVVRADLQVPVLSDGNLEPPPGGELRASESATVASIAVREGERVTRGTALIRLDDPELTESARKARADALLLTEEKARTAAELEEAGRAAAHAREVFEADARLLKEGAIPRAASEADELSYRQAQDRLRTAEARASSIDGKGRASRLALAQEQADDLEKRATGLTLRAPLDGVAYGLPRKIGEAVAAGQIVANVADPRHLRVRARIDQPDLPRVQVGQRFLVTFDGLPERRWEGTVLAVSTGVRESGGREVGEVLGEVSDPNLQLPPNGSVNVQIVVGERHGVLTVPRAAVLRDGDKRFVYRMEDKRARRRDISVGLIGLNEVEVTGGLSEKDEVILPGSVPLSEGLRVSPARKRR